MIMIYYYFFFLVLFLSATDLILYNGMDHYLNTVQIIALEARYFLSSISSGRPIALLIPSAWGWDAFNWRGGPFPSFLPSVSHLLLLCVIGSFSQRLEER